MAKKTIQFEEPIPEPSQNELEIEILRLKEHPDKWARVKNYDSLRGAKMVATRLSKGSMKGVDVEPGAGWEFMARPINADGEQDPEGEGGTVFARFNPSGQDS